MISRRVDIGYDVWEIVKSIGLKGKGIMVCSMSGRSLGSI